MTEEFKPHSHVPYGSGDESFFYSDHMAPGDLVLENAWEMVSQAIENVHFEKKECHPFTIAEYGAADGGVSLPLIRKIIDLVRKLHGKDEEILICYEDQITNDFNKLFQRVQGMHDMSTKSSSCLRECPGVFAMASASHFFTQCFPTSSVNFGFSSLAMQWLFKRPCILKSVVHHTGTTDEYERQAYAKEARESWERILLFRAKEIAPGGHMVVAYLGRENEKTKPDETIPPIYESLTKHWKSMLHDKTITQEEFEETTFNEYFRTIEEVRAPFEDHQSPVYLAGLRLVSVSPIVIPCPYRVSWMKSPHLHEDSDARKKYAKEFVTGLRLFSNSTFLSALSSERSGAEKQQIADEMYQRYENDVASCPSAHSTEHLQLYVHFRKEMSA